jgi:hypothetical protein
MSRITARVSNLIVAAIRTYEFDGKSLNDNDKEIAGHMGHQTASMGKVIHEVLSRGRIPDWHPFRR